jgi:CheY-like chemotaxis protein
VPKTLLAVDDSATMRKVLEITFAGEEFRVVSADGAQSALARLGEDAAAAVIDMSLGNDDGYALAKEVRARNARVAVVLMASRYTPYDAARGRDAGVDDFIDKPFDTQSLIDKVKKALAARESAPRVAPPPPPVPTTTMPLHTTSTFGAPRPAAPGAPPVATGVPRAPIPTQRTHTLSFEGSPPGPPPPVASAAPVTAQGPLASSAPAPATAPLPTSPSAASPPSRAAAQPPPVSAAARPQVPAPPPAMPTIPAEPVRAPMPTVSDGVATVNGAMAVKLGDLGLTPEQVTAVLALSREVVERVVWEVVPQLAETIIREEITRLTKEA